MKIKKIFTSALSLCGESNTAPYLADFAVDWANTLLAELYETEQSIRAANGEQLLSTVPVLITAEDEAPCARICGADMRPLRRPRACRNVQSACGKCGTKCREGA